MLDVDGHVREKFQAINSYDQHLRHAEDAVASNKQDSLDSGKEMSKL